MISYIQSFFNRRSATQLLKVAVIGVGNTIVDFGLFNLLRVAGVATVASITVAFAVATLMSYLLNRRWTFEIVNGRPSVGEGSRFFAINIIAWAVTVAVVEGADAIFGPLTLLGENLAKASAVIIILLPKFASYRDVVFKRSISGGNDRDLRGADRSGGAT